MMKKISVFLFSICVGFGSTKGSQGHWLNECPDFWGKYPETSRGLLEESPIVGQMIPIEDYVKGKEVNGDIGKHASSVNIVELQINKENQKSVPCVFKLADDDPNNFEIMGEVWAFNAWLTYPDLFKEFYVPPAVLRKIDGKMGVLTPFIASEKQDYSSYKTFLESLKNSGKHESFTLYHFLFGQYDYGLHNLPLEITDKKSVLIDHANILNPCCWEWNAFPFSPILPQRTIKEIDQDFDFFKREEFLDVIGADQEFLEQEWVKPILKKLEKAKKWKTYQGKLYIKDGDDEVVLSLEEISKKVLETIRSIDEKALQKSVFTRPYSSNTSIQAFLNNISNEHINELIKRILERRDQVLQKFDGKIPQ